MRAANRFRSTALLVVVASLCGGCALGKRPTLVDEPVVEDQVVRSVLDRFANVPGEFTATYEITPSLTGEPTAATVTQSGTRRDVKIGEVSYITDGTSTRTCDGNGNDCVDGIDEARISNLSITHQFWSDSAASKLELDEGRSVAAAEGRTDNIAGQTAWCADVQVPSVEGVGTVTYCVLDAGVLARYFGADVSIELTSYSTSSEL